MKLEVGVEHLPLSFQVYNQRDAQRKLRLELRISPQSLFSKKVTKATFFCAFDTAGVAKEVLPRRIYAGSPNDSASDSNSNSNYNSSS